MIKRNRTLNAIIFSLLTSAAQHSMAGPIVVDNPGTITENETLTVADYETLEGDFF